MLRNKKGNRQEEKKGYQKGDMKDINRDDTTRDKNTKRALYQALLLLFYFALKYVAQVRNVRI